MKLVWSNPAKNELVEIRRYSVTSWGRSVAVRYLQDLRNAARAVAAPHDQRLRRFRSQHLRTVLAQEHGVGDEVVHDIRVREPGVGVEGHADFQLQLRARRPAASGRLQPGHRAPRGGTDGRARSELPCRVSAPPGPRRGTAGCAGSAGRRRSARAGPAPRSGRSGRSRPGPRSPSRSPSGA